VSSDPLWPDDRWYAPGFPALFTGVWDG
jgi:hypothetical protein